MKNRKLNTSKFHNTTDATRVARNARARREAEMRANLSLALVTRRTIVNDILRELDTKILPSIKSELT